MNLGLLIILITILGTLSNWLNWRYLNYRAIQFLYYIGAFIHETSHALLCVITGAKIEDYVIFSRQPHVIYRRPKLAFVGELLISFAPIAGGLLLLFLINKYFLVSHFKIPEFSNWLDIFVAPFKLLLQINLFSWQSWLMILLFLNVGAMIGPSWQDLKNIWPAIIILFFFNYPWLANLGLTAIILILTNILIQFILILIFEVIKIAVSMTAKKRLADKPL